MLFTLGKIVGTPDALALLESHGVEPKTLLDRHVSGDWGDVDDHDHAVNDQAVKTEGRILSVYDMSNDQKVWIITEWDRSATTLLLPSNY